MKEMNRIWMLTVMVISCTVSFAQTDSTSNKKKEKIKTGWTFGAVPVIAYDSDIGFKYGGLVNFFNYGNGSTYPEYKHSIYLEWSQTTKGSGINNFRYDSKYLIPNIRTTVDVNYLTEKALDFYGFNGYNAYYNSDYEDDEHEDYISRMYYRIDRKLLRITADFQGKLFIDKLLWVAGYGYYGINLDTVDVENLNKGKSEDDRLPYIDGGLYGKYTEWGIIPGDQSDGGNTNLFKLGVVYDSRDNEPNPFSGIWTEAFINIVPGFISSDYGYTQLSVTHRQYFTILPNRMNFAYRLGYQTKLSGDMPHYMLPLLFYSNQPTRDGLGGSKTIRGILRNRIVGEGMVYCNLESRWKLLRTVIWNQNLYIAFSGFMDGGMVTKKYEFDTTNVPREMLSTTDYDDESIHLSYGAGLHFALNENFIVAVDYGRANDNRDGNSGLYIGLNFLF